MRTLVALALMLCLSACDSVSYYSQALRGQTAILLGRQPIDRLLQDPTLDARLRAQLELVVAAREFAERELQLPAAGSFTSYVDPRREHMVWNVFAAPWNSVEPVSWCFPIAGCVAYRGYFSEQAARRYAERLTAQGYDVHIGGVDAYSTLGWFKDPLPAPVLRRADHQLAALVFHELSHQRIYLPGDSRFNESFASFVEQEGLQRWQQQGLGGEAHSTRIIQQAFTSHVADYRERLRALYAQAELPEALMRARKQQLLAQMREQWQAGPYAEAYRGWFSSDLNNAQLSTVATYTDWVPAFEQLFAESGSRFESFYSAVEALAGLPAAQRQAELERLALSPGR